MSETETARREISHSTGGSENSSRKRLEELLAGFEPDPEERRKLDKLGSEIKELPQGPVTASAYAAALKVGVDEITTQGKDGKLTLTQTSGKNLGGMLWDAWADSVAQKYLGFMSAKLESFKQSKNPDTGKSQYEDFMSNILGVTKESYQNNVATRPHVPTY